MGDRAKLKRLVEQREQINETLRQRRKQKPILLLLPPDTEDRVAPNFRAVPELSNPPE